ncbi:MAG: glycosyltransferase family 2 protein [Nitrospinae bacterium]|nr:glycosyltransferase family 2 protein [Nitrospinota bacterium]
MRRLVAVPVFNEERHVRYVVEAIRRYYQDDLLFVNDGSTDGSAGLIESLKDEFRIIHLSRKNNIGYGRSTADAFNFALQNGYDQLVTMDCDEQHEPAHIPGFFEKIAGVDVCSCSRYLLESEENDPAPTDRLAINREVTSMINSITGYQLTDSFCGMKGYRVEALRPLDLREAGYAFPLEFWVQAFHFGLKVVECPGTRIYKNLDRSFGRELDDPAKRLEYYYDVLRKELKRWSISLPSELIPTTSR